MSLLVYVGLFALVWLAYSRAKPIWRMVMDFVFIIANMFSAVVSFKTGDTGWAFAGVLVVFLCVSSFIRNWELYSMEREAGKFKKKFGYTDDED